MNKQYSVILTGESSFASAPTVFLEYTSVNLHSSDGMKTWENVHFETDVDDILNIELKCEAISGTGWKFEIKDLGIGKTIYEAEGETGERLRSRSGRRIPNFSERIDVYDYSVQKILA